MKKSGLPEWLIKWIIGITVFLTAFFLGQFISIWLRGRTRVPPRIHIVEDKKDPAPAGSPDVNYVKEAGPLFEQNKDKSSVPPRAAEVSSSNRAGAEKTEVEIKKEQEVEIDWSSALSNPSSLKLQGTVIGPDSAMAFIDVNGQSASVSIAQTVGGYRVESITQNSVVFKKGDKKVNITMGSGL